MTAGRTLRIATRGSQLAIAQAERVRDLLLQAEPSLRIEITPVSTEGDRDKTSPLTVIGGRGVFTSGIQDALLTGAADIAVHSAKDLPSSPTPGLVIAAFPEREDPRDVIVSRHDVGLADLPPNPVIGTSSRRRAAQVLAIRPDAVLVDLRGNIDTRLRKAESPEFDAVVIAAAGLTRMGWDDCITEHLDPATMVPSPGQGALAVEARHDDSEVLALLARIDDPSVRAAVTAERAFLVAIGAGCTQPIGAHAAHGTLRAFAASEDLTVASIATHALAPEVANEIAAGLAERLLATTTHRDSPDLLGERVLITRPVDQAGPLVRAVIAAGAEAVVAPAISILPVDPPTPEMEAALAAVASGGGDWLLFTSANAVEAVIPRLDPAMRATLRIGAIGTATAAALRQRGVVPTMQARMSSAAGLAEEIAGLGIVGATVVVPQGNLARPELADRLRELGANVMPVVVYRTEVATKPDRRLQDQLAQQPVSAVTLTSPSAVAGLHALLGGSWERLHGARTVCVGETTAAAAEDAGLAVAAIAPEAGVDGLMSAIRSVRHAAIAGAREGRG